MKTVLILLAIGVALFVMDRLLLAAESRGWIYWRKKSASPGTTASAMLEMHSIVEPSRGHMAEALRAEEEETDYEGDDLDSRG